VSASPTPRTDAEYRRLRAFEGLLVAIVAVVVTVAAAVPALVAATEPLRAVARSLTPSP
jgi:hypothetical protein